MADSTQQALYQILSTVANRDLGTYERYSEYLGEDFSNTIPEEVWNQVSTVAGASEALSTVSENPENLVFATVDVDDSGNFIFNEAEYSSFQDISKRHAVERAIKLAGGVQIVDGQAYVAFELDENREAVSAETLSKYFSGVNEIQLDPVIVQDTVNKVENATALSTITGTQATYKDISALSQEQQTQLSEAYKQYSEAGQGLKQAYEDAGGGQSTWSKALDPARDVAGTLGEYFDFTTNLTATGAAITRKVAETAIKMYLSALIGGVAGGTDLASIANYAAESGVISAEAAATLAELSKTYQTINDIKNLSEGELSSLGPLLQEIGASKEIISSANLAASTQDVLGGDIGAITDVVNNLDIDKDIADTIVQLNTIAEDAVAFSSGDIRDQVDILGNYLPIPESVFTQEFADTYGGNTLEEFADIYAGLNLENPFEGLDLNLDMFDTDLSGDITIGEIGSSLELSNIDFELPILDRSDTADVTTQEEPVEEVTDKTQTDSTSEDSALGGGVDITLPASGVGKSSEDDDQFQLTRTDISQAKAKEDIQQAAEIEQVDPYAPTVAAPTATSLLDPFTKRKPEDNIYQPLRSV